MNPLVVLNVHIEVVFEKNLFQENYIKLKEFNTQTLVSYCDFDFLCNGNKFVRFVLFFFHFDF